MVYFEKTPFGEIKMDIRYVEREQRTYISMVVIIINVHLNVTLTIGSTSKF